MKEQYKTKIGIAIANSIYDVLILVSCLTLWAYSIMISIRYGVYSKESTLIFFPTVILIYHCIATKVSRADMMDKDKTK